MLNFDATALTWHRYHGWLLNKFKGSGKRQLVLLKSKRLHGTIRWAAEYKYEDKSYTVYQFQCTRKEIKRSKYLQKTIPNPFLSNNSIQSITQDEQHRLNIVTNQRYSYDRRNKETSELSHLTKLRDNFQCVRCGSRNNLDAHHIKGAKQHFLELMVTLCKTCHSDEHNFRK